MVGSARVRVHTAKGLGFAIHYDLECSADCCLCFRNRAIKIIYPYTLCFSRIAARAASSGYVLPTKKHGRDEQYTKQRKLVVRKATRTLA